MNGDGSSGLSTAILLAMVLIVTVAVGGAVWLARNRGTARGWSSAKMSGIVGLAILMGLVAGGGAVSATFFESSWSPPPQLELQVPPGYDQTFTILLEDPKASGTLDWTGSTLPFAGQSAAIEVPASGIVRVPSFGAAEGRGDLNVIWSDGVATQGVGGGPAPLGSRANSYILLVRPGSGNTIAAPPSGGALAKEIASRERR
jgi:hypothetical protein